MPNGEPFLKMGHGKERFCFIYIYYHQVFYLKIDNGLLTGQHLVTRFYFKVRCCGTKFLIRQI